MQLAGYKLGRVIEREGCCTTFNALDAEQSKTVLVKMFAPELCALPSFLSHFHQVTGLLAGKRLGHNIPIRDAFVENGVCAFVTNYHRHTAPRLNERPRYSEDEVVKFGMQLAEALSMLHAQGLVHGGVELANIHIQQDGDAMLDVVALQRTMPGQVDLSPQLQSLQDPQYLAPEADLGLTPATDFYSLGVVLYELLGGQKPYASAASPTELATHKRGVRYAPLDTRHRHLKPLFDSLLASDPISRIDCLDDFLLVLSQCWAEDDLLAASSQFLTEQEDDDTGGIAGRSGSAEGGLRRGLAIPALGFTAVIALIGGYLYLSPAQTPEPHSSLPRANDEARRPAASATPAARITAAKTDEPVSAYQQALALYESGEYETALQILNSNEPQANDSAQAAALARELRDRLEIDRLGLLAQQQFAAGQFISPQGDNALESYRRLAELTNGADPRAMQGMELIAQHYTTLAQRQLQEQHTDVAQQAISDGLKARPDFAPLLALQAQLDRLAQQSATPAESAPAAASAETDPPALNAMPIQPEPAKRPLEMTAESQETARRQREQQRALEARRQAEEKARLAEARKRETERREEQLREQRLQAQERERLLREAEIERLMNLTEAMLGQTPATRATLARAIDNYRSAQDFAGDEPRLRPLRERIIRSHITLATSQMNAEDYTASTSTIEQAMVLDRDNAQLKALRESVEKALAPKIEKPEPRPIPIIGTF